MFRQTYSDVLATLPDSNAIHLIDLALQLAHAPGFPESKIKQLHQRMDKNSFAHQTLADLVVGHLLFVEVTFARGFESYLRSHFFSSTYCAATFCASRDFGDFLREPGSSVAPPSTSAAARRAWFP